MAVVVALGAVGGGVWAGYRWLTTSPRFAITEIAVAGTHRIAADQLRARLPVHAGDNVFADLEAIGRAVRSDPWVASAQVHRRLPHTIAIDVREHVAAAAIELADLAADAALYLADADGQLFKRADGGEADQLPLITGIDRTAYAADQAAAARTLHDAIAAADTWRTGQRPAIRALHVDAHGALTLHTQDPAIAIQLGALGDGIAARMRTFDAAWAGLTEAERARAHAVHLDVRPDHVTVAFAQN